MLDFGIIMYYDISFLKSRAINLYYMDDYFVYYTIKSLRLQGSVNLDVPLIQFGHWDNPLPYFHFAKNINEVSGTVSFERISTARRYLSAGDAYIKLQKLRS